MTWTNEKRLARGLQKYIVTPSGCWEFTGCKNPLGYGMICVREGDIGKSYKVRAHRASYEKVKGPIPEGYHVHHVCENKSCINPDHLIALTPQDHIVNYTPGSWSYENRHRTHCNKGHERTPENRREVRTRDSYVCKICELARDKARWPQRSEARRIRVQKKREMQAI